MGNGWFKFTIFYVIVEIIVSIGIIVGGIIFERSVVGYIFSRDQQLSFAHLILSYGCLSLIFNVTLSICLLISFNYVGFIILAVLELILGILSIVTGVFVFLKPTSILQHGFIDLYIGRDSTKLYIIGGICCGYGLWVIIHAITTLFKARSTRADFKHQARLAKRASEQAKSLRITRQNERILTDDQKNFKLLQHQQDDDDTSKEGFQSHHGMSLPNVMQEHNIDLDDETMCSPISPNVVGYSQNGRGKKLITTLSGFEDVNGEHVFDMEAPLSPRTLESAVSDDNETEFHVQVQ